MLSELSKNLIHKIEDLEAQAAVAVLLKIEDGKIQVLFVNRAEKSSDPWSGQTGLPGGKRDLQDKDIMSTVLRETLEETNINLLNGYRFLGIIEPFGSIQKPEMKIVPFFFIQNKEQNIKLNEELTGFFWAPLKELIKHEGNVIYGFTEYPCYIFGNRVIWGLTYRIINKFLSILLIIEKSKGK
ncbi:MAG: CoA pyrophosphatase [Candidatus Bathyarchaeota archaeon]